MKTVLRFGALLLFLALTGGTAAAGPGQQAPRGEEYTVQAGDWLSKIAEKYYGSSYEYPGIVEATNAKAAEDASFAVINDPNFLKVGQKLWVPRLTGAESITAGNLSFTPVTIEALGIETVAPENWPAISQDDPLFEHAWSAGIFSVVSFTTMPGNDALAGAARLLRASPAELSSGALGGDLIKETVNGQDWVIYSRDQSGINSIVAATTRDKVIYQIRLLAETSQSVTILSTILSNFNIFDPTAAQQSINIQKPASGLSLTNPFELRGTTGQYPFKGALIYRVLDAQGNQVGRGSFQVAGKIGSPATFAVPAQYAVPVSGPGTVEVAEISETDGTIITLDSAGVNLIADPDGYSIIIDDPAPFASVSGPVQVRGKTGDRPFEGRLNYRIVDADGMEISNGLLQSSGQIGEVNLFDGFAGFKVSRDGPGRIEVYDIRPADGAVFAIGTVNVWLVAAP